MVEIETESLGKPLVATDLGFSSEAVKNGYNGVKVRLGDIQGFVKAVRQLWDDPEGTLRMGVNARTDYEEKYTPEHNYEQLMEIYNA